MITEFKLSENEIKDSEAFEEKHLECARKHPTTIGWHITYCFTPSSIGTVVMIRCNLCGEEKNITDYDLW